MDDHPDIRRNAAAEEVHHGGIPVLSICVPFFRFDAAPLLARLAHQALPNAASVEILVADDGSDDAAQIERLTEIAGNTSVPVTLTVFARNIGRARIRDYLTGMAAGNYVLFMDSDMYPDADDFVDRYFHEAKRGVEDIVVGGCSYKQIKTVAASQLLYYYHSDRTQCVPLARRRESPLQYVFTNNMMIRRSLLVALSFDTGYVGWGYEDTDLAIGAARAGARIQHIENTATHFGLIDDDALIHKYRNSVANYLRLVRKFPSEASVLPVYRAAHALSRLPLPYLLLSRIFRSAACASVFPVKFRYMCLQSLKLSLYSQAMRGKPEP